MPRIEGPTGRFGDITISAPLVRALADMGYTDPTPIQGQTAPILFQAQDLVGQAQTGSGKTTAFGLPMIEKVDPDLHHIQGLVLVPTRELALQVTGEFSRLAAYAGIHVVPIYGGEPIARQFRALERGAHIIVGTPGRVIDHLTRGTIDLSHVRFAVLDEADEMLDIGFAQDMIKILRRTPKNRQTALFSATVPTFIRRLIYYHLKDPVWVRIGEAIETVPETEQLYCEVAERDKLAGLLEVLGGPDTQDHSIIFCRMQTRVDRLARELSRRGYDCRGIHGGMPQGERDSAMRGFRQGNPKILVATNVAARGLDVPTIKCVINFDMPDNVEDYVHRIGRTSRMGRPGTAITLVSEWNLEAFDLIKDKMGDQLSEQRLSLY